MVAADFYFTIFEWLAEAFKSFVVKFSDFVKEENSIVGEGNFTGARRHSPTDQSGK